MPVKDIFKVTKKTFFNPSAWFGYDSVKSTSSLFWSIIKNIFVPTKIQPGRQESFEQAMQRLNLSEKDIQETGKNYFIYACIFVVLAAATFIYGFYMLFHLKEFIAWVISMAIVALLLSQAFRFHFWYFQIKHRTLGCTIQEWWQGKPNADGES